MDPHSVLLFHGFSICSMVPNPVSWILILFHGCSLCSMDLHAVPWILIVLWSLILFLNCHSVSWIYTLFHESTLCPMVSYPVPRILTLFHGPTLCSMDPHSVPWSHTLFFGSSQQFWFLTNLPRVLCSMWFYTNYICTNNEVKSEQSCTSDAVHVWENTRHLITKFLEFVCPKFNHSATSVQFYHVPHLSQSKPTPTPKQHLSPL